MIHHDHLKLPSFRRELPTTNIRHSKTWTGQKHQLYRYRYRNDVPLRDGDDALRVNWMELTIMNTDGTVTRRFSFVSDLTVTDANILNMIAYGRSRWKNGERAQQYA